MIEKLLETLFRHKLLVFMPPVLIPLIVAPIALLTAPSYYQSVAGIWAERPLYLSYREEMPSFLTPAQSHSIQLAELLKTRQFVVDVASRTNLEPTLATPGGEERARDIITRGFTTSTNGSHLLLLVARTSSAELSYELVTAVAEAFRDRAASDRIGQAELATSFYQDRLKSAEDELAKANDALRRYLSSNSRLTGVDSGSGAAARLGLPTSATDPQLGELTRQAQREQQDVDAIRTALERARMDVSASLEGQQLGFQVADEPRMAGRPITERRGVLIYPVAGLTAGFILSSALLVLLLAADRSARTEADLAPLARVLGTVPQLELSGDRSNPHGARRAIGFVAGAALPAPSAGG